MPEFNPTIHGHLRQPNKKGKANLQNFAGKRFNRLLVYGFLGMDKNKQATWLCRCDCGKWWVTIPTRLKNGESQSCGCWNFEKTPFSKTHGLNKTLAHRIWSNIKTRTTNPNNHAYSRYGGKGIALCAGMRPFEGFLAVVGQPPEGKDSIDRWPNNETGGYWCGECDECSKNGWPMNVRWADDYEQSANRGNNVWLTYNSETLILAEWERRTGVDHRVIGKRLRKGMSSAEALGFKEP